MLGKGSLNLRQQKKSLKREYVAISANHEGNIELLRSRFLVWWSQAAQTNSGFHQYMIFIHTRYQILIHGGSGNVCKARSVRCSGKISIWIVFLSAITCVCQGFFCDCSFSSDARPSHAYSRIFFLRLSINVSVSWVSRICAGNLQSFSTGKSILFCVVTSSPFFHFMGV